MFGVQTTFLLFKQHRCIPQKFDISCAMICKRTLGPILFEPTISTEVYHDIIQQFIALLHEDECEVVFQQDNEQPHNAKDMISFLKEFFVA